MGNILSFVLCFFTITVIPICLLFDVRRRTDRWLKSKHLRCTVFGSHRFKRDDGSWFIIENPSVRLEHELRIFHPREHKFVRLARQC